VRVIRSADFRRGYTCGAARGDRGKAGANTSLTGLKFYTPAGAKLHPHGFATCLPSVIDKSGPGSCPKKSAAGANGFVVGVVSFGGERVKETASVQPFSCSRVLRRGENAL
jgi:hypothetical protein